MEPRKAICILNTAENETGKGTVYFEQDGIFAKTHITGNFSGLKQNA